MGRTDDWGRGELKTPTSIEEFVAEIETDPDIDLSLMDPDHPTLEAQDLESVDAEKMEITYQGKRRTITSVVKIMRVQGSDDSADILENLIEVGKEAKKLVTAVRKKATGSHPRPVLRKQQST